MLQGLIGKVEVDTSLSLSEALNLTDDAVLAILI